MATNNFTPRTDLSLLLQFMPYVRVTDGCWLWTGATWARQGYGQIQVAGRRMRAHRVSYELFVGDIPAGLFVCHACDIPPCVNPAHLWLGTATDNVADRDRKARTATGDRSGSRLHPDKLAHGNKNWTRHHPERLRGELNPSARLTETSARAIKMMLAAGEKQRVIAKLFGVSKSLVGAIGQGKLWRHVTISQYAVPEPSQDPET